MVFCAETGNPSAGLRTEHSCLTPCTTGPAISETRSTWNRQREAGVNATVTAHRGPQEEECLLDPASLLPYWTLASSPVCAGQREVLLPEKAGVAPCSVETGVLALGEQLPCCHP